MAKAEKATTLTGNVVEFPAITVAVEPGEVGWAIVVRHGRHVRRNPFFGWRPAADEFADRLARERVWGRA